MVFTLSSLLWVVLTRLLILLGGVALLIWAYAILRCRLSLKQNMPLRELQLSAVIEGVIFATVLFFVYLFFFIKLNGWQKFVWNQWTWDFSNLYFMLIPEILTIVLLSILFFALTKKLTNLYK